jgi:(1->4)-alpha-D-glucan 1-alpha-D-glucosylmutase
MRINRRNRVRIHGDWVPDRNDEYLFYQALVGVWPAESLEASVPERAPDEMIERLAQYMAKATREAKVHTSWIRENAEYGHAVDQFVRGSLGGATAKRFLIWFVPFHRRVARIGMINALAQLVLKLTSPGVPDFYQGSELWDYSLVDPDNRHPVDFPTRQALLDSVLPMVARLEAGGVVASEVDGLIEGWPDGRIKLFITTCGLRFRREHVDLMRHGDYQPLVVEGASAEYLVAFARHDDSGTLVTVAPRLIMSVSRDFSSLPRGLRTWGDTRLVLPPWAQHPRYRHVLTGETVQAGEGHLAVAEILHTCPVGLLWADAR